MGLVAKPTDTKSIRRFMQISVCVWGGVYNPIIPAVRRIPAYWRDFGTKAADLGASYVKFFEPDILLEAEEGLAKSVGASKSEARYSRSEHVLPLSSFLDPEMARSYGEPAAGVSISDVLNQRYISEQRFSLRDPVTAVRVKPDAHSFAAEAMFGCYPEAKEASYFAENYDAVFQPEIIDCNPAAWLRVYGKRAMTPLWLTAEKLEKARTWEDDVVVFVFDPRNAFDVIDLWNLRLEPSPVLPVPIQWLSELRDFISEVIVREDRPLQGNPNGIRHGATVEFARSVSREATDAAVKIIQEVAKAPFSVKPWRTPIWRSDPSGHQRIRRMQITAAESSFEAEVTPASSMKVRFEGLTPDFAARFGRGQTRWVNVVRLKGYGLDEAALPLPFNVFDRSWPSLRFGSEQVIVSSEGWVIAGRWKGHREELQLLPMEDAISSFMLLHGIHASPSDSGVVGRQIAQRLEGLRGLRIIASVEVLTLLNKMAGSVRRRVNNTEKIEETFPGRSADLSDLHEALGRASAKRWFPLKLKELTDHNVLRLGLSSECPQCRAKNWHGLDSVDYSINCERCLNSYEFPQGELEKNNKNFRYRVVGPFAVPDFAYGAYASLLALAALKSIESLLDNNIAYCTGTILKCDDRELEVDGIAFWQKADFDAVREPKIIFAETKSFGAGELILAEDIARLRYLGGRFPGSVLVVAVMRESFTTKETALIRKLAEWGRRDDASGNPANLVVALTGRELFSPKSIRQSWEEAAGKHKDFASFDIFHRLEMFADATQVIYLGLPRLWDWQATKAKAKAQRRSKVPVS